MQPLEKRPTNYARNVYHAISAVAALIVVHHVFIGPWLVWSATAFFVWVWGVELARHYSPILNGWVLALFGKVIHPAERNGLSSGAWYALGLLLLALQGDELFCKIRALRLKLSISSKSTCLIWNLSLRQLKLNHRRHELNVNTVAPRPL